MTSYKQSPIDYLKLNELSQLDAGIPLYQKILKLQEEAGEVAQEFLAYDSAKNASKSASGLDLLEEVLDVAIVAHDIINYLINDDEDYFRAKHTSDMKLKKWQMKIMNYPPKD